MQDFGTETDVVTANAVSANEHSILNGLATETGEEHVDNALPIRIDNHPISSDSGLQSGDDSTSNSAENSHSESPTDIAKRVIDQMESSSSTDSLPSPTTEAADLPQQKPASATAKRDVSSLLTIGREDVLVPDPAFTVEVLVPGIDAFELQMLQRFTGAFTVKVLEELVNVFTICHYEWRNEMFGLSKNELSCALCSRPMFAEEILPCLHLLHEHCRDRLIGLKQKTCPAKGCDQPLELQTTSMAQTNLKNALAKFYPCRNALNSFFMKIASSFLFADEAALPAAVVFDFLLRCVTQHTRTDTNEQTTSILSALRKDALAIDLTPVIRTFLLQVVLKLRPTLAKAYLRRYFQRNEPLMYSSEDRKQLALLFVQCVEDTKNAEVRAAVLEQINWMSENLRSQEFINGLQTTAIDERRLDVDWLFDLAVLRVVLATTANLVAELVSRKPRILLHDAFKTMTLLIDGLGIVGFAGRDVVTIRVPHDESDVKRISGLIYEEIRAAVTYCEHTKLRQDIDKSSLIQVFLRTLSGRSVALMVARSSTVGNVKDAIEEKLKISACLLRITFEGKNLEDGRTLGFYNICKESTLHLSLRLRGGIQIPTVSGISADPVEVEAATPEALSIKLKVKNCALTGSLFATGEVVDEQTEIVEPLDGEIPPSQAGQLVVREKGSTGSISFCAAIALDEIGFADHHLLLTAVLTANAPVQYAVEVDNYKGKVRQRADELLAKRAVTAVAPFVDRVPHIIRKLACKNSGSVDSYRIPDV